LEIHKQEHFSSELHQRSSVYQKRLLSFMQDHLARNIESTVDEAHTHTPQQDLTPGVETKTGHKQPVLESLAESSPQKHSILHRNQN
jgi:hypothetical protein